MSNPNAVPGQGSKPNLVSKGISTDLKGLIHCHLPRFSYRHGMIPKLYVMPWKQDMKYRALALKHADLVGLYTGAPEDTLFLDKCERHCHGEDRKQLLQKVPQQMAVEDIPIYSHLSRYHKSMVAYGFRIKL
ncbi:sperm-associated microtubule inner protein 10 [Rhineura floridana]|uniref:sperm-associated microtubule inner protein 10 n=1 Tax=Rhineura floridana TaxID=261503 RepID=UPI002AC87CB1|nr:sperm-associated microtubule inner protein 10 [Rhineura floridana]